MNTQLLLFSDPQHAPEATIQERFSAFHDANPWVYHALVRLARDQRLHGRKVGMKMLFEVLRWQWMQQTTSEDEFKLNNNYHSRYARLIMERNPDLTGMFQLRELTAE